VVTTDRAAITERCRDHAAALVPGASCNVRFDGEDGEDADLLCVVGKASLPIPDRTRIAIFPVQTMLPLHAMLSALAPAIGRPFRPGAIFSHVGGRSCAQTVRGIRAEYWLRNSLITPRLRTDRFLLPAAARLATVGGIGNLPAIGANIASVVTCIGVFLAGRAWDPVVVAAWTAILSALLCLLVEKAAARYFLSDDAREFVLDEVTGMAVALCFLPAAPPSWLFVVALVAFRFFDILKPGIQWVERLPIPGKVMWDDALAGLYAGLVVLIVAKLVP
jgi:phosphatidylglycerophosphatase A